MRLLEDFFCLRTLCELEESMCSTEMDFSMKFSGS
jgi:hypothetical protein